MRGDKVEPEDITVAVRNFWLEAYIDGRKTPLRGGPRARSGGMTVTIWQRDQGSVARALDIECYATECGQLLLVATGDSEEHDAIIFESER